MTLGDLMDLLADLDLSGDSPAMSLRVMIGDDHGSTIRVETAVIDTRPQHSPDQAIILRLPRAFEIKTKTEIKT